MNLTDYVNTIGSVRALPLEEAKTYFEVLKFLRDNGTATEGVKQEVLLLNKQLSAVNSAEKIYCSDSLHRSIHKFTTTLHEGELDLAAALAHGLPWQETTSNGWLPKYNKLDEDGSLWLRKPVRRGRHAYVVNKMRNLCIMNSDLLTLTHETDERGDLFMLKCGEEWMVFFSNGVTDVVSPELTFATYASRWSKTSLKWLLRNLGL